MYDSTLAFGFETIYVHLKDYGTGFCPYCGSEVIEIYPDSGHTFVTLRGWKNLITFYYQCTNPNCTLGEKFKASQPYVLPYKKFGQDVWLNICFEWEKFKTTPNEIKERLANQGVYISEDTIAGILQDYKMLKHGHTDKRTREIIANREEWQ